MLLLSSRVDKSLDVLRERSLTLLQEKASENPPTALDRLPGFNQL